MHRRLNTLYLGATLALSFLMIQPAMADEWNKRIEFQFSAPVEVPGNVLAPGKYAFELADSDSDRNIVRIFSLDPDGHENLVSTIMAIPSQTLRPSDKPTIQFEERNSGAPEAIHRWFYPGDDTGWEFVYPKEERLQSRAYTAPDSTPVAAAVAVNLSPAPKIQEKAPAPKQSESVAEIREEAVLIAQNDPPPSPPAAAVPDTASQTLPQTGGHSGLELFSGLVMLTGGIAAVLASHRKSRA
jgi:hypothetical protein